LSDYLEEVRLDETDETAPAARRLNQAELPGMGEERLKVRSWLVCEHIIDAMERIRMSATSSRLFFDSGQYSVLDYDIMIGWHILGVLGGSGNVYSMIPTRIKAIADCCGSWRLDLNIVTRYVTMNPSDYCTLAICKLGCT
jgi:hypothetical protein